MCLDLRCMVFCSQCSLPQVQRGMKSLIPGRGKKGILSFGFFPPVLFSD